MIFLFLVVSACNSKSDNPFGTNYNIARKDFGAPLVKQNMHEILGESDGTWTVYTIDTIDENDKQPSGYHQSKTIRTLFKENVSEEEDIYRKKVGSKMYQLNILSRYNWSDKTLELKGNVGMLGERNWKIFSDSLGIDSVLISWGLSRFDEY